MHAARQGNPSPSGSAQMLPRQESRKSTHAPAANHRAPCAVPCPSCLSLTAFRPVSRGVFFPCPLKHFNDNMTTCPSRASYLQVGSIYKISRIQWDLYLNLGPKCRQFPINFQWLRATPRKHAHNPGRTSATTCFLRRKPSFIRLTPMFSALFSSRTVMPYRVPEESELPPHFPDVLRWSKSELKQQGFPKKTSRRLQRVSGIHGYLTWFYDCNYTVRWNYNTL